MKILRICPNVSVGLGSYMRPFIRAMEMLGIEQKVLSEDINFKSKKPFSVFRAGFEAVKGINFEKYDFVHIHNPSYWGAFLVARGKTKLAVTFHGSVFYTAKHFYVGNIVHNIYYLLNGIISMFLADAIIFLNKKDQLFFSKFFRKKCFFIPPGIDLKVFKHKSQIENRRYDLLFVGRDMPNKNLSAAKKFASKNGFSLNVVLGDNSFSQAELVKLYNDARFIISPSYYEGFAKVVLEGIACGCIPIVSDSRRDSLSELGFDFFTLTNFSKTYALSRSKNLLLIKNCSWKNIAKSNKSVYEAVL